TAGRPQGFAKGVGKIRFTVKNIPADFVGIKSNRATNIGPHNTTNDINSRDSTDVRNTLIQVIPQFRENATNSNIKTKHLSKGVKVKGGEEWSTEAVKATFDSIRKPPKGVVIPRTPLFDTVSDIVVVNPHTIEFRMSEPRPKPYMLGAFASGWNIIVRKKTLE